MNNSKVANFIEVDGKNIPLEHLPEEKRRQLSAALSDNMMVPEGYKRQTA